MKRISLILSAAICLVALGARAADSLTMADFVYTNKLMVAGYTGTTPLTDFPVLVRISTSLDGFSYSNMRSSKGGDLAFFAEDGTRLASEVDTWDTSGISLVWVNLPSMTQGTKFYMCYRLTDELAALDTWVTNDNPWGDYVGVWHLSETGPEPGTQKTIADATTNALDGVTSYGQGINANNGAVGRARRISNQYNKTTEHIHVSLSDSAKRAVVDGLVSNNAVPEFTVSFWYRIPTSTPVSTSTTTGIQWEYFIGRRQEDKITTGGWAIQMDDNAAQPDSNIPGRGFASTRTREMAASTKIRPALRSRISTPWQIRGSNLMSFTAIPHTFFITMANHTPTEIFAAFRLTERATLASVAPQQSHPGKSGLSLATWTRCVCVQAS